MVNKYFILFFKIMNTDEKLRSTDPWNYLAHGPSSSPSLIRNVKTTTALDSVNLSVTSSMSGKSFNDRPRPKKGVIIKTPDKIAYRLNFLNNLSDSLTKSGRKSDTIGKKSKEDRVVMPGYNDVRGKPFVKDSMVTVKIPCILNNQFIDYNDTSSSKSSDISECTEFKTEHGDCSSLKIEKEKTFGEVENLLKQNKLSNNLKTISSKNVDLSSLDSISGDTSILSSIPSTMCDVSSLDNASMCSNESIDNDVMAEWARLKSVLNHIDSKYLVEYLKRRINSKDYSFILSLSMLLPKHKFTGETIHCVRCHEEYDEIHGDMSCVLRHPQEKVELISEDSHSALFQCINCCSVFKLEGTSEYSMKTTSVVQCGACFVGVHTYDVDEVNYQPEGDAERCADKGCVEFFV